MSLPLKYLIWKQGLPLLNTAMGQANSVKAQLRWACSSSPCLLVFGREPFSVMTTVTASAALGGACTFGLGFQQVSGTWS